MIDSKVAIHGIPRSGTSWLGAIFDSSANVAYRFQPLFSYAFKGALTDSSTSLEIDSFFLNLSNTNDDFILQKFGKSKGNTPEFNKSKATHLVYKEVRYHYILENLLLKSQGVKVIGLIRSPLSTICSWYMTPNEFRKDLGWNLLDEWRYAESKNLNRPEEYFGYEKWKEVAALFQNLAKLFPKQFRLVKYSDLLRSPIGETKKVFKFCNLQLTQQTLDFINESSIKDSSDYYSVYRKEQSDTKWRDNLPDEIVDFIKDDLKNSDLEQYL